MAELPFCQPSLREENATKPFKDSSPSFFLKKYLFIYLFS